MDLRPRADDLAHLHARHIQFLNIRVRSSHVKKRQVRLVGNSGEHNLHGFAAQTGRLRPGKCHRFPVGNLNLIRGGRTAAVGGTGDAVALQRLLISLRVDRHDLLQDGIVARKITVRVLHVHAHCQTVLRPISHNAGIRIRQRAHLDAEGRGVPVVRQLEEPHCGVIDLPRGVGIRCLDAFFIRIQAFDDMIILVRLTNLPVRHPEPNGNLRHRLRVRGIERVFAVVAEHRAVRVAEAEDRLQPALRLRAVIRAGHDLVALSGRTGPVRLQAIRNILLVRFSLRIHVVKVIPVGAPGRTRAQLNQ